MAEKESPTTDAVRQFMKEEEPTYKPSSVFEQALVGLLPTVVGAAFGGSEGGAIGAKAGQLGLRTLKAAEKDALDREERRKEFRNKTLLAATLQDVKISADNLNIDKKLSREIKSAAAKAEADKNKLFLPRAGYARSEADRVALTDRFVQYDQIDDSLRKLISFRKNIGNMTDPKERARAESETARLLLVLKDQKQLGVLQELDKKEIMNLVGDPTALGFQLTKLLNARDNNEKDIMLEVRNRTIDGENLFRNYLQNKKRIDRETEVQKPKVVGKDRVALNKEKIKEAIRKKLDATIKTGNGSRRFK